MFKEIIIALISIIPIKIISDRFIYKVRIRIMSSSSDTFFYVPDEEQNRYPIKSDLSCSSFFFRLNISSKIKITIHSVEAYALNKNRNWEELKDFDGFHCNAIKWISCLANNYPSFSKEEIEGDSSILKIHKVGITKQSFEHGYNNIVYSILIFMTNKRLNELHNDLLDYLDMEQLIIMKDPPYQTSGNDIKVQDFRQEIWNNINRRGEKAKLALLQSIESKVKSWVEIILRKN